VRQGTTTGMQGQRSAAAAVDASVAALRQHGVSAIKGGVAGVVAWLSARALLPNGSDFYAPLVAVLSVQPTVAGTVRDTAQRLMGVAVGLGLGYVVVATVGLHWWSLGAVLTVASLLAQWRRLGDQGVQVPIAALLVLLFANEPTVYAANLLGEGLVGALTAAAVNFIVLPPLYVRSAGQRLAEVRAALGDAVDAMSRDVGECWPPTSPDWLGDGTALDRPLAAAREAVERGSESLLLNPRGRRLKAAPNRQRQTLTGLERINVILRDVAGTLEQAADPDDQTLRLNDVFRPQLAAVLRSLASALTSYGDTDPTAEAVADGRAVDVAARQVRDLQERLKRWEAPEVPALLAEGALVTGLALVVRELQRGPLQEPRGLPTPGRTAH
jgi:hypothetical protein